MRRRCARGELDEADGYLDRIRTLDATAAGLADGEQRLDEARQAAAGAPGGAGTAASGGGAARYAGGFEEAMQAGDLDRATRQLAGLRRADPEAAGLPEKEQRLAAAREVEQERQRRIAREVAGEMVSIPAGSFRMGDLSGEGGDAEKPVHQRDGAGLQHG